MEDMSSEGGFLTHQKDLDEIMVILPIQSPSHLSVSGRFLLNSSKKYQCDFCDYSSNRRSNLKAHMNHHGQNLEFQCQICNYSSNQKSSLTIHSKTHHLGHQHVPPTPTNNTILEPFEELNDFQLELDDEESESNSCSRNEGLVPMSKVPHTSHLIANSLKKRNRFPMSQPESHPFFLSKQRERKRRFQPLGLLTSSQFKKRMKQSRLVKRLKSLRLALQKSGIPFQSETTVVERPVTPQVRSPSPLAEDNPFSQINAASVFQNAVPKGKKMYKCSKCDYTVGQYVCFAYRIEQHEKNHEGNGRHKCDQCSFSHNLTNILKLHVRFHHRKTEIEEMSLDTVIQNGSVSLENYDEKEKDLATVLPRNLSGRLEVMQVEESVQISPDADKRGPGIGVDSSTSEIENTNFVEATMAESPSLPPDLGGPFLNDDVGSPGSPPYLGEAILNHDLTERTMNCDTECPNSPPVLEALVNPDTQDSEQDDSVRSGLPEEDAEMEERCTSDFSPDSDLQDPSSLLQPEEDDSLIELEDDSVDQELPEVIPESTEKTEQPRWNSSKSRIKVAKLWMEKFNIFFESAQKSKEGTISMQAKLMVAESECRKLFDEFHLDGELQMVAMVRLRNDLKNQQLILQTKSDNPDIREARSKVESAKEAILSADLRLKRIREEEKALREKMQEMRDTKAYLQAALHQELKINQETLESVVFKAEESLAEMSSRQKHIESIKEKVKEVDKNLQTLLDEERALLESSQRADDAFFKAFEQQSVHQKILKKFEHERNTILLHYQEEMNRFTFATEKIAVYKQLHTCLLKIQQELFFT